MFQKLLKIKLLLILLNVLQAQKQIKFSMHDFNVDYINDIFYGKRVKQSSQQVGGLQCENEFCMLNTVVKEKVLLQRGNVRIIELSSPKLSEPLRFELSVIDSTTTLNYEVKYLSPFYDTLYGLSDDSVMLLETKNLHHGLKSLNYLHSSSFPKTDNFRNYKEVKEITEVSEKFKCGAFLSSQKLTQVVAIAPRPNEGFIVLTPGTNAFLRLKVCIKELDKHTKSSCIDTTVNAGETITLPEIEGFEEELSIKILDLKTPKIPINMQDIIGEYTYSQDRKKLSFSKLHVGNSPAIGSLNRDSIAPIQTSTIVTENYLGDYKSFEPKSLMSWNLISLRSPEIPWSVREKINYFSRKVTNLYGTGDLNNFLYQLLDTQYLKNSNARLRITQKGITTEDLIMVQGTENEKIQYLNSDLEENKRIEDEVVGFTDMELMLKEASQRSAQVSFKDIEYYRDSLKIFCEKGPELLILLSNCLDMRPNSTDCVEAFVSNISEISKDNKYLAAYFGIFQINDELVSVIEKNIETFCIDDPFGRVDKYMRTIEEQNDRVLRAFWIPIIIGLVLLFTVATGVGVTEGIAQTKECAAQETEIPVSKQRSQINSYPNFESLAPGILKEIDTDLVVSNNKPTGTLLNMTNFEDQTVEIEVRAKNYRVDVKQLRSKIQNYAVTKCDFYLSKALSTCEIIFNNIGEVSEVDVEVRGQSVLSVSNKIIVTVGVNKHNIQLSTPEIIDKNIQICLIDSEKLCESPDEVNIVENPEIEGNDLVPRGGKIGTGSSAFDFFNLLNVNISFAAFIWTMWIIGFISLIILLIMLCSVFRWTSRKAKKICCDSNSNRNYVYGDSYSNGLLNMVMVFSLLNLSISSVDAWHFSMHELYNNPRAYVAFIWNRPYWIRDEHQPTYGGFEYKGFTGLMPPFYDYLASRRLTVIEQYMDLKMEIDLKFKEAPIRQKYDIYDTDCLTKGPIRKFCLKRNSTLIKDNYQKGRIGEIFSHWSGPLDKVQLKTGFISEILTQKLPTDLSELENLEYSYFKIDWTNEPDAFQQLIWKNKPKVHYQATWALAEEACDYTPKQFFYKTDGKTVMMSFVCVDQYVYNQNPMFYRLRNYTFFGKVDNPSSFAYTILMLNKLYINNVKQPIIMIVASESLSIDIRYLENWLRESSGSDNWQISPGILADGYAKIVMLWCDNCVASVNEQSFQIKTGRVSPEGSFCLLPSGKVSGAEVGEGTRVKCTCDSEQCYCFNIEVKLFVILKIKGYSVNTLYNNHSLSLNLKEVSVKCFNNEGGEIQLNKEGDFVAVGGPIQITSDNWDNIDVIETGKVIKAPINEKVENDVVEIKTLGKEKMTFLSIQTNEKAKESTFKNTWDKMNQDYPYVIPITIAVPSLLILLLVFSCCYRYCKGGKRMMKIMSYPITKATNTLYKNFGVAESDLEKVKVNNDSVIYSNNLTNSDSGIKFRQRSRRPVM